MALIAPVKSLLIKYCRLSQSSMLVSFTLIEIEIRLFKNINSLDWTESQGLTKENTFMWVTSFPLVVLNRFWKTSFHSMHNWISQIKKQKAYVELKVLKIFQKNKNLFSWLIYSNEHGVIHKYDVKNVTRHVISIRKHRTKGVK